MILIYGREYEITPYVCCGTTILLLSLVAVVTHMEWYQLPGLCHTTCTNQSTPHRPPRQPYMPFRRCANSPCFISIDTHYALNLKRGSGHATKFLLLSHLHHCHGPAHSFILRVCLDGGLKLCHGDSHIFESRLTSIVGTLGKVNV